MKDLEIFRKLNCPENVIQHCLAVSKNAVLIAEKVRIPIDKELVRLGGLFHDIGRCRTHSIRHAIEGSKLIRKLDLGEEIANIAERHIGAGITPEEAKKLGLPVKDYTPRSPEEKIVAYADNLTQGNGMISFEESLKRFKRELGEDHPSIKRMIDLHKEIQAWINR